MADDPAIKPRPPQRHVRRTIRLLPEVWALLDKIAERENDVMRGSVRKGGRGVIYPVTVLDYLIRREAARMGIKND